MAQQTVNWSHIQQEAWRLYAELLYVIEICNHFVHMFESVYIIFL